jgi:hypothetical protein
MAKNTIGDVCSRIRTQVKAFRQDALLTDRVIYSFVIKHAKWLMRREDSKSKLLSFASVIQTLDSVELIEVDKVEAQCTGIRSNCRIKRTKDKLPIFLQGYWGPLIRNVTSLDGSQILQPVIPSTYVYSSKSKNTKYNTRKYFWYLNDYLYFPDLDWDAVRIEGIFEDDVSFWTCEKDSCIQRQDQSFNVPDYLLGEIESQVFKDLAGAIQIPPDNDNDKISLTR